MSATRNTIDLTGKVAVVTEASSGIGEATARALADHNCAVALVARREDRLTEIAAESEARTHVAPTDVTDVGAVAPMVEEVRDELGGIDILVNNAGIARGGPVGDADLAELRQTIRVNLQRVMNVTHAALPASRDGGGGDIITVSSLSARYPQEAGSAYTPSKFGVNGFCRPLRKELSDEQVRVTIVMPGATITELNDWKHWDGRAMDPSVVAETIVFALTRPAHVELTEVSIDTTDKF